MKAMFVIPDPNGGVVELRDVPQPAPKDGELLVRVRASTINRAELARRRGAYQRPGVDSFVPSISGGEFAGEVVVLGREVSGFQAGDRVFGRAAGSHAEFVTVDARAVSRFPDAMSYEEAASIPTVFVTAHDAIVTNGGLKAGESFLVNAASSGVGIAALQIARLIGANPIIGTSTSNGKLEQLASLGMTDGIATGSEGLVERVTEITNGRGVDLIIDNVGGDVLEENLRAMAILGRLVSVGRLGTHRGSLNLDQVAYKRVKIIGVTFRTRTAEESLECSRRMAEDLMPAFEDGRLHGVIDRVFPLEELDAAHAYMATNAHVGKIVLRVD